MTSRPARRSLAALERGTPFARRHIGPDEAELARMAEVIGVGSLEDLADRAIPGSIRTELGTVTLPDAATEAEALAELRALAARNNPTVPMIGMGYHGTETPPVILRL